MSDFELPSAPKREVKKASLPSDAVEVKEAVQEETKKDSKYKQEDLLRIFDEIIFSGEYQEDVTINGRLKVRFRTRAAGEIEEISRVVDSTQANLIATLNEKRSVLNLQYALLSYQGKDLSGFKVEDKAKFIRSLPGPVIAALLTSLAKFDEKVFAACQEGEENF